MESKGKMDYFIFFVIFHNNGNKKKNVKIRAIEKKNVNKGFLIEFGAIITELNF